MDLARIYLMTKASNAILLIYLVRFSEAINTKSLRGNTRLPDVNSVSRNENDLMMMSNGLLGAKTSYNSGAMSLTGSAVLNSMHSSESTMFDSGRTISTSSRDLLTVNYDSTYSFPKYHDPAHAMKSRTSSMNGSSMMNARGANIIADIGSSTAHGSGKSMDYYPARGIKSERFKAPKRCKITREGSNFSNGPKYSALNKSSMQYHGVYHRFNLFSMQSRGSKSKNVRGMKAKDLKVSKKHTTLPKGSSKYYDCDFYYAVPIPNRPIAPSPRDGTESPSSHWVMEYTPSPIASPVQLDFFGPSHQPPQAPNVANGALSSQSPSKATSNTPSLSLFLGSSPSEQQFLSPDYLYWNPTSSPSENPSIFRATNKRPSNMPSISLLPSNFPSEEPILVSPSSSPSHSPGAVLIISQAPNKAPSHMPSVSLNPRNYPREETSVSPSAFIDLISSSFPSATPGTPPNNAPDLSQFPSNGEVTVDKGAILMPSESPSGAPIDGSTISPLASASSPADDSSYNPSAPYVSTTDSPSSNEQSPFQDPIELPSRKPSSQIVAFDDWQCDSGKDRKERKYLICRSSAGVSNYVQTCVGARSFQTSRGHKFHPESSGNDIYPFALDSPKCGQNDWLGPCRGCTYSGTHCKMNENCCLNNCFKNACISTDVTNLAFPAQLNDNPVTATQCSGKLLQGQMCDINDDACCNVDNNRSWSCQNVATRIECAVCLREGMPGSCGTSTSRPCCPGFTCNSGSCLKS